MNRKSSQRLPLLLAAVLAVLPTARPTAQAAAQVGAPTAASPAATDSARFDYADVRLPNGLRIVVLEDFSTPVVAVQVWYHVGSKDENPERQGFAHMFEHMMFRGTERLGPKEHFESIRRVGGDCNAYTSYDQTVYIQKLPSNQLELALYLESERLAFLKIDQRSFDTERAVVEEEARQRIGKPYGTIFDRLMGQLYTTHPYRWSPIGKIPHLRAAATEELARFWETYYVPNNATLVIVGAVKKQDAIDQATRYFGWIPPGTEIPRVTTTEPAQPETRTATLLEPKGPLTLLMHAYRTVPAKHPDATPLDILSVILGDGESSRLYRELVKEKNLAVNASVDSYNFEQGGFFRLTSVLKPNTDDKQPEINALLSDAIARVQTDGVTPEELEKAKLNLLKNQVGGAQTVEARANLLGTYALVINDLSRVNTRFDEIRKVTADDIKRVATMYLTPAALNAVTVEPAANKELLKAAPFMEEGPPPAKVEGNPVATRQGAKATAVRPASFPTTAPIAGILDTFPDIATSTKTLPNGLKVVVVPKHQTPLVTFTLGAKVGSNTEPTASLGHAAFAAKLLTQGTENYDATALADILDRNAISLSASVGTDISTVNASCLTEQADLTVKLLAEVTRRATFPEKEFDQLKTQTLASLAVSEQDPKFLADRELRKQIFGTHPYGRSAAGESADVSKLDRNQTAIWWRNAVNPSNTVLYVAGDLTPDAAFALAEKYFADWKPTDYPSAPVTPPTPDIIPPNRPTTIYLVDKPGLGQSEIRMGQLGINRKDPRWPTSRVLTQIFGGQFSSRLMEAIRVKRGLTYGIYGVFRAEKDAGVFQITTFSKTATTAETVEATLAEIARMKADPITPDEINNSKNFLIGSFAGDRETPQQTINDLWLVEYASLPANFMKTMLAKVATTTEQDLKSLASETLDEKNLVIVVVGDAAKIKPALEKIAPVVLVTPPTPPAK